MGILNPFSWRSSKHPPPSDDFWYTRPGGNTAAGVAVSEKDALKYLTVFSCVSLISGDLARLPLILYRRLPKGGKERYTDHALYDLLHNAPNDETNSFLWRELGQMQCLLWGNHYSFIERKNGTGEIKGLWQLTEPGKVDVLRVGDRLVYKYKNGRNEEVARTRDQIFHVPGFGFNGLVGTSMITLAREAIGLGLATEKFGANYFGEGTHPAGALEIPTFLGDKREEYTKSFKKEYSGLGKSHSVMILEGGSTYKPITIPLEDAQFLESRDHQKIEICGMYHVPPHKIGIHKQNSNRNNLEEENASYVDSCLMQWIVRWESAITQQLLTKNERKAGLFVEFLVDGLLRGDSEARAEYYSKMLGTGSMSPNDIRAKENMNPIDGGDQYFVPLNYVPLAQAGQIMAADAPDTPEDEENTREIRTFWENRSIIARDRISKQYAPLLENAIQAIVNRETKAIKTQLSKFRRRAQSGTIEEWIEKYYKEFAQYVERNVSPVFRSFMAATSDESMIEIGQNVDKNEVDTFIDKYSDAYIARHISSSTGQIYAILRDAEDEITEVETRMDEWHERRAQKETNRETVRASSAMFQMVAFAAGLSVVWRIRGPETCPYCRELNGKRIARGGSFLNKGDVLEPKGADGVMKISGTKTHPQLHDGCDCYLSI